MKKLLLGSFSYNLSYAFFLLAILGGIYSLTDISEMAFSFIFIHVNDYLIFKAYYSIAVAILSIIAYFIQNEKLIKITSYLQIWLIPLGPFLCYVLVKGLSDENKETALRVLFISVSLFIIYMSFFLTLTFIALVAFGIIKKLPTNLQILAYFVGIFGIYSLIGGILGLLTGAIRRLLNRIGKITSYILAPHIPFGTMIWLISREIKG